MYSVIYKGSVLKILHLLLRILTLTLPASYTHVSNIVSDLHQCIILLIAVHTVVCSLWIQYNLLHNYVLGVFC